MQRRSMTVLACHASHNQKMKDEASPTRTGNWDTIDEVSDILAVRYLYLYTHIKLAAYLIYMYTINLRNTIPHMDVSSYKTHGVVVDRTPFSPFLLFVLCLLETW